MNKSCESFREEMPKALLDDLSPEARQILESHLVDCPACRLEWELCRATVQGLQSVEDVAVPRHFFVHPYQQKAAPWRLFQQLSSGWQAAIAFAILMVVVGVVMIASSARFQASQGMYSFSFGKPPATANNQMPSPLEIEEMRREVKTAVEQNLQRERLETVRWLQTELARSNDRISQQQGEILKASLARLESRLNERLKATGTVLQARSDREFADLYGTLQAQRQQDLLQINASLNRVVAAGEVKDKQTEDILDTLLQVAQLKLQ